jgi:hypothetical protein
MAKFTGLTGLAGYQVQIDADAQATAEQRLGSPANPRHNEGPTGGPPYPYQSAAGQTGAHGPYGPENQLLGDEQWFIEPAGHWSEDPYMDQTPSKRAGPFPKGIASGPVPGEGPDAIANQLHQSYAIHGVKTRAGFKHLYSQLGDALNDEWQSFEQLNPGHTELTALPKQAMSSGFMWGTRDRTQSMARQNEHGFDSAHMWRRWAVGAIPGNNMWMRPGGRPLMKSLPGPARPAVGVDSPFHGDDLGASFGIDGAILQSVPTEYLPPPAVQLAPQLAWDESYGSVVELY